MCVEFRFLPAYISPTYLSGASKALGLSEEICKGHEEDEGQVGEEKNKVPEAMDEGAVEPLDVVVPRQGE